MAEQLQLKIENKYFSTCYTIFASFSNFKMNKKIFFISLILSNLFTTLQAQVKHEQTGWLYLKNNTKINDKWGINTDIQLRSQDAWDGVRGIQMRSGLAYYITAKQIAVIGYFYSPIFIKNGGTLFEHRIWEQFNLLHNAFTGLLNHRFRLEQRFAEKPNHSKVFGQRFCYYCRDVQPLKHIEGKFNEGMFLAMQNEIFFNIQNKQHFNNHLFDQNQAYIALGYRFSKKIDVEAGYMNVYAEGATNPTVNNVVQLACYTRF